MDEFVKQLDKHLDYLSHEMSEKDVIIYVKSNRTEVECPYCGKVSTKCHSTYERSFQDLPIKGKRTKIIIINRKMFCKNPECTHTTFAETYDFLAAKGKKTKRLVDKIVDVSLNMSSVTASQVLKDGIADVGKSTICNLLKKRYAGS